MWQGGAVLTNSFWEIWIYQPQLLPYLHPLGGTYITMLSSPEISVYTLDYEPSRLQFYILLNGMHNTSIKLF